MGRGKSGLSGNSGGRRAAAPSLSAGTLKAIDDYSVMEIIDLLLLIYKGKHM